jgi:hypothetical protein
MLFEQRFSGRRRPDADLSANTPRHLIASIGALRRYLAVFPAKAIGRARPPIRAIWAAFIYSRIRRRRAPYMDGHDASRACANNLID